MTDPKKTEALFLAAEQEEARAKYEALLDDVIHEVHRLTTPPRDGDPAPDDSEVHVLLQRLRDEFGPEVPR